MIRRILATLFPRKPAPKPMPASIKAQTRSRPCFDAGPREPVWPLRNSDGRTWADAKADRERRAA